MGLFHTHIWNILRTEHWGHAADIAMNKADKTHIVPTKFTKLFCTCRCGKADIFRIEGKWNKSDFKEGVFKK